MIQTSTTTVSLCIRESSQVGEARRLATAMATTMGFPAGKVGKVGIAVTEAATNLLKHAQRGDLLFRPLLQQGVVGLELLVLDKGPGMADVERCIEDGYSTAGSPGTGLGAMKRLSTFMDVYSQPQAGTGILCRFWAGPLPESPGRAMQFAGVSVAVEGETLCGDSWGAVQRRQGAAVMVADGLGHGPLAAEAAEEVSRLFREPEELEPAAFLQAAHGMLRSTRGAALAMAEVNLNGENVRYAGIGNIAAAVLHQGTVRNMISHSGIVGVEMRKVQEFSYPFPRDAVLIMNSDGLNTRWTLDPFPGLLEHHPALIAGILFRDFRRERDDVTVVVGRAIV